MEFNTKRCHALEMGKSEKEVKLRVQNGKWRSIEKAQDWKDLGVTILDDLQPESHVSWILEATCNLVRSIGLVFLLIGKGNNHHDKTQAGICGGGAVSPQEETQK